jgi:hypothetical protein
MSLLLSRGAKPSWGVAVITIGLVALAAMLVPAGSASAGPATNAQTPTGTLLSTITGAAPGDSLIAGVVSGNTALIRAPGANSFTGAAYIINKTRAAGGWRPPPVAVFNGRNAGDQFGGSVALSNKFAVIGDLPTAFNSDVGSVSIYKRSGTGWSTSPMAVLHGAVASDQFGSSVAIWKNTIFVGAFGADSNTGSVYVYNKTRAGWGQAPATILHGATANDQFGSSLAVSGNTLVVGATGHNSYAGEAYVFNKTRAGWSAMPTAVFHGATADDVFGDAVAVSGRTVVVGAFGVNAYSGAAYVYTNTGTGWHLTLTVNGVHLGDECGVSVAVSGSTLVIGAPAADNFTGSGTAYIYTNTTTGWQFSLALNGEHVGDEFGTGVAVSGITLLVGAPFGGSTNGRVYFYRA